MNLFILEPTQNKSVQSHCDKHVVKMVTECAQILVGAHWLCDKAIGENWYKPTHLNHPTVKWAAENLQNYLFVFNQFTLLSKEYTWRYGRIHGAWGRMGEALREVPEGAGWAPGVHDLPLVMPATYNEGKARANTIEHAVSCYRAYYRGEKYPLFSWKRRGVPGWVKT